MGNGFADLDDAQAQLETYVAEHNHHRSHDALDMRPLNSWFHAEVTQKLPADASTLTSADRSGDEWIARRVSAVGVVSVAW